MNKNEKIELHKFLPGDYTLYFEPEEPIPSSVALLINPIEPKIDLFKSFPENSIQRKVIRKRLKRQILITVEEFFGNALQTKTHRMAACLDWSMEEVFQMFCENKLRYIAYLFGDELANLFKREKMKEFDVCIKVKLINSGTLGGVQITKYSVGEHHIKDEIIAETAKEAKEIAFKKYQNGEYAAELTRFDNEIELNAILANES